jgi:hypothetical protein
MSTTANTTEQLEVHVAALEREQAGYKARHSQLTADGDKEGAAKVSERGKLVGVELARVKRLLGAESKTKKDEPDEDDGA